MKRSKLATAFKTEQTFPSDIKYTSEYNAVAPTDAQLLGMAVANVDLGGTLVLEPNRLYVINEPLNFGQVGEIIGNNATLKPSLELLKSGVNSCILWNDKISETILSTPIAVTARSKTVTLPANFDVKRGDMLYFRGKRDGTENWVTDPNPGGTGHYFHGMYAVVQSRSGTLAGGYTVKLSTTFYANFTVVVIARYQGVAQQRMSNLNIDMTNSDATCTKYIEGMSIYGKNLELSGVNVFGNEYGTVGCSITGVNAVVSNSSFERFLCIQGQDNGSGQITGRTGYGLLNNCNNSKIDAATFSDCKHSLAAGSHYSVGRGMRVLNSIFTEDETLPYTPETGALYEGTIDLHCGMTGRVTLENCEIAPYNKMLSLRTKSALIRGGEIRILGASGTSLVAGFEQDFDGIIFDGTDFFWPAGSNQAIFAISGTGGVPGVSGGNDFVQKMLDASLVNCRFFGGDGTTAGGYLLNISRQTFTVDGFSVKNSEAYGLKGLININPGTSAQCALNIRNLDLEVRMSGCEQIINCYVETPAANPATDLYYFRNWDFSGVEFRNPLSATLSPVSITSPVDSRNVEIKDFRPPRLIDLTSTLTAASTAYCMILQVSVTGARMAGTVTRGPGAQQARGISFAKANYSDFDWSGFLSDSNLSIVGSGSLPTNVTKWKGGNASMRDLRFEETTADIRFTNVDLSGITANLIRFACRAGSTAWANSTEVVLADCTMTTATGYALEIDANSTGHKILRRNNRPTSRNQVDLSGTYYGRPLGNANPVRTYSVGTWGKGATTTFNLPNLNAGTNGGSNPFLTVGQLITIAGVTGTGAAAVNGKTVPVIAISGSTVTVPIDTSAEAGTLNSSGNITTTSSIDWKGGTQADPDGRLLSVGVPTAGTWNYLEKVEFTDPFTAGYLGAVCKVPGAPGTFTFKRFAPVEA